MLPTATTPTVSIVIPVFNKWELTWKCLMAVAENTRDVAHEVIVIDNASSDETAQALPLLDNIRFARNTANLGFAKASNQGAAMARGQYVLFLNNDTEPTPGWLPPMVAEIEADPAVAIVGSKLLYPDGTVQHGGVVFAYAGPEPITPLHLHARQPASASDRRLELRAVTAACMLMRPDVFREHGGFDEAFVNGGEDVDLCLKVWRSGRKIVFTPASVVVHHESASDGRFRFAAANADRLNSLWLDRFDAFDVDFRPLARPIAADPARPGASVIVIVHDALWTVAPCLENIRFTLGAQDELIVVDDASRGASARFVAQFAAAPCAAGAPGAQRSRARLLARGGARAGGGDARPLRRCWAPTCGWSATGSTACFATSPCAPTSARSAHPWATAAGWRQPTCSTRSSRPTPRAHLDGSRQPSGAAAPAGRRRRRDPLPVQRLAVRTRQRLTEMAGLHPASSSPRIWARSRICLHRTG